MSLNILLAILVDILAVEGFLMLALSSHISFLALFMRRAPASRLSSSSLLLFFFDEEEKRVNLEENSVFL